MSTQNLTTREAQKKIAKMADNISIAMLLTDLTNLPISTAPMTTKKVDDSGNIWFLSEKNSVHNDNILKDSRVQLIYSHPSEMEFMSIYGKAEITTDPDSIEKLYSKIDDAWFSGKKDPNITVLKVSPREAYYWDTKQNKYISLLKVGAAAITGNKADIGKKGKMNIH